MRLTYLKGAVEKFAPGLARSYRVLRDELQASRMPMARMPEGFWLAGDGTMQRGDFEPEERRILERELQNADVFVDVGANVGYYTCMARAKGLHVVAVEPLPLNLRHLFRALETNEWDDVETWPVAVAERPGSLPMWGASTGASLVPGWAGISMGYRQVVPVTTLDTLLERRFDGKRLLVKMDIEGAEYRALLGGSSLLNRNPHPVWLLEVTLDVHHPTANRHFADTFDLFFDRGYRVYAADGHETPVSRENVAAWQARARCDAPVHNWLFVHESVRGRT